MASAGPSAGPRLSVTVAVGIAGRARLPRLARREAAPGPAYLRFIALSAGVVRVVTDVVHAGGHPGRVDYRVVLGPGADVAGQRDRVAGGGDPVRIISDSPDAISVLVGDTGAVTASAAILVVDDYDGFRAFAKTMMEAARFTVAEAATGAEASEAARIIRPGGYCWTSGFRVLTGSR
jgi:hypothetical protein